TVAADTGQTRASQTTNAAQTSRALRRTAHRRTTNMPTGAPRAAPSDNTRATRNTTTPPTPLSSRVMKGMRSTTTSDGEALSAELNIQARVTKTCGLTDRA